ncbi:MAG: chorismate mutase [Spirochaetia bacterium]|jgi:chorismate mutase
MTTAVRGAIQVEENSRQSIAAATTRLVGVLLRANGIAEDRIVSIIFSLTEDLSAMNPAAALRETGFARTPLFCTQEARIDGAMPRVIRVLLTFEHAAPHEAVPVYLEGAQALRADLAREERP